MYVVRCACVIVGCWLFFACCVFAFVRCVCDRCVLHVACWSLFVVRGVTLVVVCCLLRVCCLFSCLLHGCRLLLVVCC